MVATKVWRGRWVPADICCEDMARAFESGTDAEGYGPLACEAYDQSSTWQFSSVVKKPRFCPWCGMENAPGVLLLVNK